MITITLTDDGELVEVTSSHGVEAEIGVDTIGSATSVAVRLYGRRIGVVILVERDSLALPGLPVRNILPPQEL